jgi:hypothetical protein
MIFEIFSALFVGVLLGHRFKVLVLIPVIVVALIAAIALGFFRADSAWSIGVAAAGVTFALQIGYLIGSGIYAYRMIQKGAGLTRSQDHHVPTCRTAKKDGPAGQETDNRPEEATEETIWRVHERTREHQN